MIGTLINVAMIVAGCLIGLLCGRKVPQRIRTCVTQGLGLCTVLIGARGALAVDGNAIGSVDILCVIVSIVAGGLLGGAMDLERRVDGLGSYLEKKLSRFHTGGSVSNAFFTTSLLYCVGAMAIVGAIDSTIRGDHSVLIAKGLIDGVTAIFFTGTMGIGVALSALSVLVYQGLISVLAGLLQPLLTEPVIRHMGAVGGLLVIGVGLNLIRDKRLSVGNLLPAIFMPMLYIPLANLF